MPPALADNDFLQWVDIDNDVEIATKETVEERELEIVARYTAQSETFESEDEEEPKEPNPVPIPQNADIMPILLQVVLNYINAG